MINWFNKIEKIPLLKLYYLPNSVDFTKKINSAANKIELQKKETIIISKRSSRIFLIALTVVILLSQMSEAFAHHILGRPSYQLNEDSNTPPSLHCKIQSQTRHHSKKSEFL